VVVPPHQQWTSSEQMRAKIEQQVREAGDLAKTA
jgi:hypothetical protein